MFSFFKAKVPSFSDMGVAVKGIYNSNTDCTLIIGFILAGMVGGAIIGGVSGGVPGAFVGGAIGGGLGFTAGFMIAFLRELNRTDADRDAENKEFQETMVHAVNHGLF